MTLIGDREVISSLETGFSAGVKTSKGEAVTLQISDGVVLSDRVLIRFAVTGLPDGWEDRVTDEARLYGEYLPVAELGTPGGEWLTPSSASRYFFLSNGKSRAVSGLLEFRTLEAPGIVSLNFNQLPFDTQPLSEGYVFTLNFSAGISTKRASGTIADDGKNGLIFSVRNTAETPEFAMIQPAVRMLREDETLSRFGWITIDDDAGNRYAVTRGSLYGFNLSDDGTWSPAHAYVFTPPTEAIPLTVCMDHAYVLRECDLSLSFDIDGLNGKADISFASDGFTFRLTGWSYFSREEEGHEVPLLRLFVEAPQSVSAIGFHQTGSLYENQPAECGLLSDGSFACDITVEDYKTGKAGFTVDSFEYRIDGPWGVTWIPSGMGNGTTRDLTENITVIGQEPYPVIETGTESLDDICLKMDALSKNLTAKEGWVLQRTETLIETASEIMPELIPHQQFPEQKKSLTETFFHIRADGTVNETVTVSGDSETEDLLSAVWGLKGTQVILPQALRSEGNSYTKYAIPYVYDSDFLSLIEGGYLPEEISETDGLIRTDFRLSPFGSGGPKSDNDIYITYEISRDDGIVRKAETVTGQTVITRISDAPVFIEELPEDVSQLLERIVL